MTSQQEPLLRARAANETLMNQILGQDDADSKPSEGNFGESMYARMYQGGSKRAEQVETEVKRSEIPDRPVDIDDIDLIWDNPEMMHGRRQDVLDIIQKRMRGELRDDQEEVDDTKSGSKTRVPLFPKAAPQPSKPDQSQSALQDSNVLESLFSGPLQKNDKSFKELIEQNREKRRLEDDKFDRAVNALNTMQNNPQSRAERVAQKKAVYVTDIQKMGVNPNSIIGSNATTKKDKFLGTAAPPVTTKLEEKITHNSKFFRLTAAGSKSEQETSSTAADFRNHRGKRLYFPKNNKADQLQKEQEARKLEIKEW